MDKLSNDILSIGIILTFIGTIINIYYTRKNIKTEKYIDTITSGRIKWLETIRLETVNIVANIYLTLNKYTDDMKANEEDICSQQGNDSSNPNSLFETKTNIALRDETEIWSHSDFIKRLSLLKLRLNPNETERTIQILDYFIDFYAESDKSEEEEIQRAKKKLDDLICETQKILKLEWKKVKDESRGKITNKKNIRWGILGYPCYIIYKFLKWLMVRGTN